MPDYPTLNYNPQPGIDYTQLAPSGTTNYTPAAAGPSFMDTYGGSIASGIGALGSLGGAWMQSRAANAATAASAKSNAAALEYEKQKYALNQQNYDAWNRMRGALLQHYGIDIAPPAAPERTPQQTEAENLLSQFQANAGQGIEKNFHNLLALQQYNKKYGTNIKLGRPEDLYAALADQAYPITPMTIGDMTRG